MLAAVLTLSTPVVFGVAIVMVLAGLRTRALERRSSRICPSCGRDVGTCRCRSDG